MKKINKTYTFAGKDLILSTGHIAHQATASCIAQIGETVCMATVVAAPLLEDRGYFPLSVEYAERLYAGGRIKGSRWVKREGKPTDDEILTARVIDRSIRPLFPEEYIKDVQVIVTVLSVDLETSPDIVGAIAVNAALEASSIPFKGPLGIVRVGRVNGELVTNPTVTQMKDSDLDLILSTTKDAIIMIEAGAHQIPEDELLSAITYGEKESHELIKHLENFAKEVKVEKEVLEKKSSNSALVNKVKKAAQTQIVELAGQMAVKEAGYAEYDALKYSVVSTLEEEDPNEVKKVFDSIFSDVVRDKILSGTRVDGRKTDELRSLSAEVAFLPRTHGSGLFQRGQTQALTVATLGSSSLEQLIETAEGEESKRYIHHYEMPPYSTGETGKFGFPKRREIGHGALAERALEPVIPSSEVFPYTIRVVTEILSSNGSTSMASVCGSTLSLMDAGVPITAPVAGIAMGVVIESEKKYAVLTDIVGIEDGSGDMDFKVAGTKTGITALQLDVKTMNLSSKILKEALGQAREARLQILDVMNKAISEPRKQVSEYAPKIKLIKIDPEKIGELIGPGGKTIKKISANTGAEINVDDDGSVSISAIETESMQKAVDYIEGLTKDVKAGEIYKGLVTRIENYGAFVEILPQKQGLVHISDMSEGYVNDPNEILSMGQEVEVRVKEIDDFKRINLSMILDPEKDTNGGKEKRPRPAHGGSGRSFSKPRSGGGRRFSDRNRNNNRGNDRTKGGPHFPMSRLVDMDNKGDKSGFNRG